MSFQPPCANTTNWRAWPLCDNATPCATDCTIRFGAAVDAPACARGSFNPPCSTMRLRPAASTSTLPA
ncbi:Uncharacterised protein [Bordetella pertussis]|nr:Uncharacterised protein [Bordetella pertussis]